MKLNYKIWRVLDTSKNPEREFTKVIYCDKDYIVATTGIILVAIPKEQAFFDFDPDSYVKMEGKSFSILAAKEMFKNRFIIEENTIKSISGMSFDLKGIEYPAWEKVIPKFPLTGERRGVLSFNVNYLKSLCEAIDYEVPVLINSGNGLLVKDHENCENGIIALLMPWIIPSKYSHLV